MFNQGVLVLLESQLEVNLNQLISVSNNNSSASNPSSPSLPPVCSTGALFNTTTGARCPNTSATSNTNSSNSSSYNYTSNLLILL